VPKEQVPVARKDYLFTSESVSEGHPDKLCDRISDEIVDLFYRQALTNGLDPALVRAACETMATTNRVIIAGEFRGPDSVTHDTIADLVRQTIRTIGYEQEGFHWEKSDIEILLHSQSADIAQGVDSSGNRDEGAGDQGIMFGYACNETPELMPAPIYYAHRILHGLAEARHSGKEARLGPDSKSQITVHYANGKPVEVREIVISHQHVDASMTSDEVRAVVEPYARAALPEDWITDATVWHVNPTGKFYIGGPDGDCGLTGPQDHRRHLWRGRPARRRRVLRQGSDESRSLGGLCGALPRQERGRGGPGGALHHPALLCHRRGAPAVGLCRPARHRPGRRGAPRNGAAGDHEPDPARHPQAPGPQPADLCPHRRLRPFRPPARSRRRLLLGTRRPLRRT
jgi:hypothetical protein